MSRHDRDKHRKRRHEKREHDEYGQSWEIAAYLRDGPKTADKIAEHFHSYLRWMGLFNLSARLKDEDRQKRMLNSIHDALDDMIGRGWVVHQEGRYTLTEIGREEGAKPLADMRRTRAMLDNVVQPETASKVSLGVHLALAGLKLPAGLISGSVGLINDATDTLLDGLSSLLVYAGIRLGKERAVNAVLVGLMLLTGGLTLYEAVRRFFVPFQPQVDWFAFVATILSAIVCLGLWAYQRFVGLRSGNMALITQSVDSRNHVIVAVSVTAGLIASLLRFPLLDTLVGLAVAILILKSAFELAIDLIRSMGEEELDFSRYKFGIVERYEEFRQGQLYDWMLYLVSNQRARTREDLIAQTRQALDFRANPTLRELGLAQPPPPNETVERGVAELFERGWLTGDEQLRVTDAGNEHLRQRMEGRHTETHRRNHRVGHRRH